MREPRSRPEGKSEILIYQAEDGKSCIQVRLQDNTVWLTQALTAELFQTSVPNISMHIRNIFQEGELDSQSVVKSYLTTAADGKKYNTSFYNLDVILSVGYRVRSHRGTQFRRWATERLRETLLPEGEGYLQVVHRLRPRRRDDAGVLPDRPELKRKKKREERP